MKHLFLLTLGVSLLLTACSENETHEVNTTADVPATVKSAFEAKFPGATDVEWKSEKENDKQVYEAEFEWNGEEHEAEFDANGNLLKAEEE